MLRDITLGQYYQTESLIHKMDPRVKLGGTVLFIISLFFSKLCRICDRGPVSWPSDPSVEGTF